MFSTVVLGGGEWKEDSLMSSGYIKSFVVALSHRKLTWPAG